MALDEPLPARIGGYEVLDRLAVGGMAEVFLGRAIKEAGFEKLVAIKRVKPHLALVPSFVEMFLDEARIAATLSHSNIVQIFDLGKADDTYFIAMEYVPGLSLNEVQGHLGREGLRASGPLAALIMMNVCLALEHAHTKRDAEGRPLQIIHRDVSPSNVVVSFDGDVKLIDFGIVKAKVRLHQTQGGEIKGKRGYISPEQLLGQPADVRSDIFAAGMVLHGLLSQRRPRLEAEGSWPPPPPSTLVEGVPAELEAIAMRAIAVDPALRFQSALELGSALEAYWQREPFTRLQLAAWMQQTFRDAYERQRRSAGLTAEPTHTALSSPPATLAMGEPELELTIPPPASPGAATALADETEAALADETEAATALAALRARGALSGETAETEILAAPTPRRLPLRAVALAALLVALPALGVLIFLWLGTPAPLQPEPDRGAPIAPPARAAIPADARAHDRPAVALADASASPDRSRASSATTVRSAPPRTPARRRAPLDRPGQGGKRDVPRKAPRLPYESL
jgi:hypothetical protein